MSLIVKNKEKHYGVKDNGCIKFSIKDVSTSSRTVCAVLNTYNFLDSDLDVLMPGCAAGSIKERGVDSKAPDKVLHALFHDLTRLPGKIITLDERTIDGKDCLYMESKLTDTVDGTDTLKNYLAGIYNQHSIGYQYSKGEWVYKESHGNSKKWETLMASLINADAAKDLDYMYRVDEIKLYEGSTVAFGANSLTPTLGMKSQNKEAVLLDYLQRIDLLEKILKTGTQSDDMMYRFELQILQLKQAFTELFDQFKIKSVKDEDTVSEIDCMNCGENGMPDENGLCPKCNQNMKTQPLSFAKKFAAEMLK